MQICAKETCLSWTSHEQMCSTGLDASLSWKSHGNVNTDGNPMTSARAGSAGGFVDTVTSAYAGIVGGHTVAQAHREALLLYTLHPETTSTSTSNASSNQCDVTCVHTLGKGDLGTAQGADDVAAVEVCSKVATDDDIGNAYHMPC